MAALPHVDSPKPAPQYEARWRSQSQHLCRPRLVAPPTKARNSWPMVHGEFMVSWNNMVLSRCISTSHGEFMVCWNNSCLFEDALPMVTRRFIGPPSHHNTCRIMEDVYHHGCPPGSARCTPVRCLSKKDQLAMNGEIYLRWIWLWWWPLKVEFMVNWSDPLVN